MHFFIAIIRITTMQTHVFAIKITNRTLSGGMLIAKADNNAYSQSFAHSRYARGDSAIQNDSTLN